MDLPNCLQLGELDEDKRDRLLDAAIGILFDGIVTLAKNSGFWRGPVPTGALQAIDFPVCGR